MSTRKRRPSADETQECDVWQDRLEERVADVEEAVKELRRDAAYLKATTSQHAQLLRQQATLLKQHAQILRQQASSIEDYRAFFADIRQSNGRIEALLVKEMA